MSLVHIYRHQNSGMPTSTLTSLAPLNIRLDALAEHIMASFILSPATINTISVGFLDPYGLPSVPILGIPVLYNLTQYIVYKISKLQLLQYWADLNLTHMADWEVIEILPFKQARDTTTVHMAQLITKCMSNTLTTMKIPQQQVHATKNLCLRCGLDLDTIQHLYQLTQEEIHGIWTASVYALQKWLKARNMDPDIAILLVNTLLYIIGERNDLPQCLNITLHSDILCINWSSIFLGFITTSLARTQQTYLTHIRSKEWD